MFVFHLHVQPQTNVLQVICVLLINAMYHVRTIYLVQSVNVVPTIYVRKFVTQTIIVYLVKFVTIKEPVNLDAHLTVTVQQLKFVSMQNVNADQDLLEHHLAALILTNVQKNHAIQALAVKTRQVPLDVFVQIKQLEILIAIQDVSNRINVVVMLIVLIIWLAYKENVQTLAL